MNTQKIDIYGVSSARGLRPDEANILSKLVNVYNKKLNNNIKQWDYYKDKVPVDNLGIAVPDSIANYLNTSTGWIAKSVDMLAARSVFDGFVIDGDINNELDMIIAENDFKLAYETAVPSELVHSCGFWTVTKGDNTKIPVIRYYNAQNAAALWDYNNRRILAGFCITDYAYQSSGELKVSRLVLHMQDKAVELANDTYGGWTVVGRYPHKMGRTLMQEMCYLPSTDRPFGKSRVSKAAMGIVDEMQRQILRMCVSCELFSVPARVISGASEEDFVKPKESLYYDYLWLFERDEDGNLPVVEQLRQVGMQPHVEVMRNLASRMSAESSIPVNSFGIIHDQPASAEALRSSLEDLCVLAEHLNRCNNKSLRNVAKLALAVYQNKSFDDLTDEEKNISVCFKNPHTPSIASQTDAMIKQASIANWLPETELYWEMLGYSDEQRAMLLKQKNAAMAQIAIRQAFPNIANSDKLEQYQTSVQTEKNVNAEEVVAEEEKVEDGSTDTNASKSKLVQK